MSSQGRGSAGPAMVIVVGVLVWMLVVFEPVQAATYVVGGSAGWTFNTINWPNGKRFKAGDVLLFNYDATIHNAVVVNRAGYSSCTSPKGIAKVYRTGKDSIKLVKGQNYFICSIPGHCQSGMKIAVNAA